jgi:hypothetical protein
MDDDGAKIPTKRHRTGAARKQLTIAGFARRC